MITISVEELAAFLAARLDEDEATAKAAASVAGPDWTWDRDSRDGYLRTPSGTIMADALNAEDEEFRPHVARRDPARALREVEAKRAILDAYVHADGNSPRDRDRGRWDAMHATVRLLAAVWSDHPDYPAERKP